MLFSITFAGDQKELVPPNFSHPSGFYPEPFTLTIEHPHPEATIYYTLDGSEPDPENLSGRTFRYKNRYSKPGRPPSGQFYERSYRTYRYSEGIPIRDRSTEPDRIATISTTFDPKPNYLSPRGTPHYKGTPIRAVAEVNHQLSPMAEGVYFIGDRAEFTLPIINITLPERLLFDYEEGIFVAGKTFDDWLTRTIGEKRKRAVNHDPANWHQKGVDIPATIHFFGNDAMALGAYPVRLRTQGFASRAYRNKSFRIYPEKGIGFPHPLYNDGIPQGEARFLLRNGGQHYRRSMVKDLALQRALEGLSLGIQRQQPYLTFINGEYNGILNARDRQDHYYLADRYQLPTRKVDLLKDHDRTGLSVKQGSDHHWQATLQFFSEIDPTKPEAYGAMAQWIDIENFIDYQIAQIFLGNVDWPTNNVRFWRYRGTKKHPITETGYTDGRWRWLLFDLDQAGGAWNRYNAAHNRLEAVTEVGEDDPRFTLLFRRLLHNGAFREQFVIRFSDLLNTTFRSERMSRIIEEAVAEITPEMPRHIARWRAPKSLRYWRKSVRDLLHFIEERPTHQRRHLEEFFQLSRGYQLTLMAEGGGTIKLNTLTLQGAEGVTALTPSWRGLYYREYPITLTAIPQAGYRFSHWVVEGEALPIKRSLSPTLTLQPYQDLHLRAIFIRE